MPSALRALQVFRLIHTRYAAVTVTCFCAACQTHLLQPVYCLFLFAAVRVAQLGVWCLVFGVSLVQIMEYRVGNPSVALLISHALAIPIASLPPRLTSPVTLTRRQFVAAVAVAPRAVPRVFGSFFFFFCAGFGLLIPVGLWFSDHMQTRRWRDRDILFNLPALVIVTVPSVPSCLCLLTEVARGLFRFRPYSEHCHPTPTTHHTNNIFVS